MNKKNNKGAVLAIVLLVLVVLGTLGIVISMRSTQEGQMALRQMAELKSFWIAEGGIEKAYFDIVNNNCQNMKDQATNTACGSCGCSGGNKVMTGSLSGGSYDVVINAATTQLNATGTFTLNANATPVSRQVQVKLKTQSVFGYAALSSGDMTFANNAVVDSYNSTSGSYGGANVGASGNVGTLNGNVTLGDNVEINGSVSTGATGVVNKAGSAVVTGSTTHSNSGSLSPVVIPSDLKSLASSGPLTFGNNEVRTLNLSRYRYDTMSFDNRGELVIAVDTEIYVTGTPSLTAVNNCKLTINDGASLKLYVEGAVDINNNLVINATTVDPTKFIIYSTYSGSNGISIKNNATFFGAVYAPDTDVAVENNGTVYGAIVGKTVLVSNNGELHYDAALGDLAAPNTPPTVYEWQEI